MLYPELDQKLQDGDLADGDLVWITGYYHNDYMEKPTRHIQPTLVQIMGNDKLPKYKNVYYAKYHFRACGKSGKLLAAVIAPYDNTGFRSRTGGSLDIFLTEDEAKTAYITAANEVKVGITRAKKVWSDRFDALLTEVDERIAKNK
jgi:hypothetical protein